MLPSSPRDAREPFSWLMIAQSVTLHVTVDHLPGPPRVRVNRGIYGPRIPIPNPHNVRDLEKALITAGLIATSAFINYYEDQGDQRRPPTAESMTGHAARGTVAAGATGTAPRR